jgi:hypothetical protein
MTSRPIAPASILEKSRMSLMIESRLSPESRTVSAYSRCSPVRGVPSRSSVMPMTPFMGVRISWLMLARKALLALLADSASSLAARSRPRAPSSSSLPTTALAKAPSIFSSSSPNALGSPSARHRVPLVCPSEVTCGVPA